MWGPSWSGLSQVSVTAMILGLKVSADKRLSSFAKFL